MAIRLVVAKGSGPTGKQLAEALRACGVNVVDHGETALVSYGCYLQGKLPMLNAQAGAMNKLAQQKLLIQKNVPSIEVLTREEALARGQYPLLGRKVHHKAGKDIVLCLDAEAVRASASDWFTPFVASRTEYRTWIYRGRHLGTYEKVLKYPGKFKKVGRNYHNGFAFELVKAEAVAREGVDAAIRAVGALGLDFGAVDVLAPEKGGCKVLEVNTAPGVEGPRQVLGALAEHVRKWEQGGYKGRREVAE